jgi:AhpD family alkylhydroperoxidase
MKLRINHRTANPGALKAMLGLESFIAESGLDKTLYELIKLRASQINGCAYCVDMHSKDLIKAGEDERVRLLVVWKESPVFTAKERAVLALTEAMTLISQNGVPESVFNEVRAHCDENEIVSIIMAVNTINSWNRIAITTGMFPGCM